MNDNELVHQIDDAIHAHTGMSRALTLAVSNNDLTKSSHDIGCDDKCAFGRWLKSSTLPPEIRSTKPYQVISRLHTEFHQVAGEVARLNEQGRTLDAFALLDGEYTERTDILVRALNKWRGEHAH